MASEQKSLEIKTKSIENTLLPLVNQITSLVNFKDSLKSLQCTEKALNALIRVGETVNLAVERFVLVGEAIANENIEIRNDMLQACLEARKSGVSIKTLVETKAISFGSLSNETKIELIDLTHVANSLLNAIIKVLLLADCVLINQIIKAKEKVYSTLVKLENSTSGFWMFVKLFTQYGSDMIELAHLTGERQNDLKNDKERTKLSSARWILERSTLMILSASKTYFKHSECEFAKENLAIIYLFIKNALNSVHDIVIDSGSALSPLRTNNSYLVFQTFIDLYRKFEDQLDLIRNNMISNENILNSLLSELLESTLDFIDSTQISNEQRDKIIKLRNDIKEETSQLIKQLNDPHESTALNDNYQRNNNNSKIFQITTILNTCNSLKIILQSYAVDLADNLFKENKDDILINLIKSYANSGQNELLSECLQNFKEYSDQVIEICRLLQHVCTSDVLQITCEHHNNVFDSLKKMIILSAETSVLYPTCKVSQENLSIYCDAWENQINDLSVLVKEIQDLLNGIKSEKTVYLSLPRPGKHGTTLRVSSMITKPTRLNIEERAKIAKLGLEMKLLTNEIEAEADKWNEPQNEIVKIAKIMSDMAYSIHLFTRGEGTLKTTQDLFAKAAYFLQQGIILYAIIKDFLLNIPNDDLKSYLTHLLEKLPLNLQQLKNKLKQQTIGKVATFNKVDLVIQETRDVMNLIAKLVTNCFLCTTRYKINYNVSTTSLLNDNNLNKDDLRSNRQSRAQSLQRSFGPTTTQQTTPNRLTV